MISFKMCHLKCYKSCNLFFIYVLKKKITLKIITLTGFTIDQYNLNKILYYDIVITNIFFSYIKYLEFRQNK